MGVVCFGCPASVERSEVYLTEDLSSHLETYTIWCEALGFHPLSFLVAQVLALLQCGVDQKLALRPIKD